MLEQRVHEAINIAMGAHKGLPYETMRDIAHEAVIAVADLLLTDEWRELVCKAVLDLITIERKRWNKEQTALKEYEEWIMNNRHGDHSKRLYIRELARTATTAREWQVLHAIYWRRQTLEEIAPQIGLCFQRVHQIHHTALEHLRMTLHAKGLTRSNWADWYFTPCKGE